MDAGTPLSSSIPRSGPAALHATDAGPGVAGLPRIPGRQSWRRAASHPIVRAAWRPLLALGFILGGLAAGLLESGAAYDRVIWYAGLAITGSAVVWRTLRGAVRGQFASDVVATLAIVAAALLGHPVVGLVIVLMQTGGEALERYAEGRASDAVRALEAAAPRVAHRLRGTATHDVRADDVAIGDLLLVRPGELIPCDAVVVDGTSHVDASMLTGESLPISAERDARLMSGSANLDGPLTVRALATAQESQYARIVALVRSAQASKAPLQRVADRYAVWFTPVTLIVCALAYAASGDWLRVLAVLAVATPCPLILATPVAVIGGINRAARQQIVFRHGGAIEALGAVRTAVFDKTGTLTVGRPGVRAVHVRPPFTVDEVLRLAGAVELRSSHVLARTVVDAANAVHVALPPATDVIEESGRGIEGCADGRHVAIGSLDLPLSGLLGLASDSSRTWPAYR